MEYSIEFKFDYFGEKGCVEEFIPYSKQLLMGLENQDYYFKEERYKEERYIEENKQEKGFIIINDEGKNKEETREIFRWKDEQDNYTDSCLWDYIADIDVVKRMYECLESINYDINNEENREKIEEIEKLSEYYWWTQLYLDVAKFDISYICRCDWNENIEDIEKILDTFSELEDNIRKNDINKDIVIECITALNRLNDLIKSNKAEKYIDELKSWLEGLDDEKYTQEQIKTIRRRINSIMKSVFRCIDKTIDKKEKFINRINKLYDLKLSNADKRKMVLSMENERVELSSLISKNVCNICNKQDKINRWKETETIFRKLKKFLYSIKWEEKCYEKKYSKNDKGCFAIMSNESDKIYFALSGYEKNNIKLKTFADVVFNYLNTSIKASTSNKQNNNIIYKWACLVNSTKRYVNGYKDNYYLLSQPEEYQNFSGSEIEMYYSCCERKLLEFFEIDNNRLLFVRWKPCYMCIPALYKNSTDIYTIYDAYGQENYYKWKVSKNRSTIKYGLMRC